MEQGSEVLTDGKHMEKDPGSTILNSTGYYCKPENVEDHPMECEDTKSVFERSDNTDALEDAKGERIDVNPQELSVPPEEDNATFTDNVITPHNSLDPGTDPKDLCDLNDSHDSHELFVDIAQYLGPAGGIDHDDEDDDENGEQIQNSRPKPRRSGKMTHAAIVLPSGYQAPEAMEIDDLPPPIANESDEEMRKDKAAVRLTNGLLNDQEEPSYNVSYTPAKKGGHFGLPMGASLSVPSGLFGKKDSVSCHVASPSERWRFFPNLPANERAISEIYSLTSSHRLLRKPMVLQIPYYPVELEYNELNVKGRWDGEIDWTDIGFIEKEGSRKPAVEIETDRVGTFVVTLTPKRELFEIPSQGCLYNARISRYISVRFPKKAVDTDMPCSLKINTIPFEKIALAKEQCPLQCGDLERVSEFIDIIPDGPRTFRRAASIKLPLPGGLDSENDDTSDVAVLQKTADAWEILDTNYRFTKTTVTFDVKYLSRFCVAQSKPDRRKKLKEAITVLEERTNKLKGEILVFLSVEKKSWVVMVEVVAQEEADDRTEYRKTKGFRKLQKEIIKKPEPEVFRFSRRAAAKAPKPKEPEPFVIHDGMLWDIQLKDDVQIVEDSDMTENSVLQYFGGLRESYRRFRVEPTTEAERDLTGLVSVIPVDSKARDNGSFMFKIEISEEDVKEYFKPEYVPPPTPVQVEIRPSDILPPEVVVPVKSEPSVPRFKPLPKDVMDRLTRPNKQPIKLEKESKVLTGKSLMALAKVVQEGLTLAVHLELPDSTITGIGFDALSNGHGMVDVTYKILLHWKRHLKDKKDAAVEQLCLALRDMGRQGAAMAVLERHRDNKELDMSCFEITSV